VPRGVIAAGHPDSAAAGAEILRAGGNAVDAAVASMLASFVAEPLLTGFGAGGYMLVKPPGGEAALLDFFVAAPGHGLDGREPAPLVKVDVDFGDAVQVFHVGPSSCGVYGTPAGIATAVERFGSLGLADLAAPAVELARAGVEVSDAQAYIIHLLAPIVTSTPECAATYAPGGTLLHAGDLVRNPELAETLARFGREGAAPFYTGDIARAVVETLAPAGGIVTAQDLAAYATVPRRPVSSRYRGREVLTNPPPSAGGLLVAYALALLDRVPGPPSALQFIEATERANAERTPEFLAGLDEESFADRFLASRLGSTTHISVLDAAGWACSVTCSNGEGSGVVVPGTGIQLNNMLGEEDLNPLGFHRHAPGRRMPSMMAPTLVLRDGEPEVVLGSAGSNRIRSAIIQTISGIVDHGLSAGPAVDAPRLHFEDGIVWAEPGIEVEELEAAGRDVRRFRSTNMFFGGVQAAERDDETGALSGGGDPRRGGTAVTV
jgi:gamma-glutamyltranspeptidase/glutathione hydrolase